MPAYCDLRPQLAMIGERLERAFRHRVDGERRNELLDVQDVGSLRVLRTRAGKEKSLRTCTGVERTPPTCGLQKLRIHRVCSLPDRDSQRVSETRRHLPRPSNVPPAD